MKLTEDQIKLMQQKLRAYECPNCKSSKLKGVSDVEYQLVSFNRSENEINVLGEMNFMPLAAADCKDCGHVMLFNLITLGVIKK